MELFLFLLVIAWTVTFALTLQFLQLIHTTQQRKTAQIKLLSITCFAISVGLTLMLFLSFH